MTEHMVSMIVAGSVHKCWRIAGEKRPDLLLRPGDVGILSRQVPIESRCHPGTPEHLAVALNTAFVAEVARDVMNEDRVEFATSFGLRDSRVRHILLALRVEVREGYPSGRLYGESLATALTDHMLRRYSITAPRVTQPGARLPAASLRRVTDYMHAHLDREMSLRELAGLVRLSPFHFARLFKQTTGFPPHRYILQQRIGVAKQSLARNRLSVTEIGRALGFPNQAHFITMFRRMVGMTPGMYRKEQIR
jgi:AraC family transcriptional regulator